MKLVYLWSTYSLQNYTIACKMQTVQQRNVRPGASMKHHEKCSFSRGSCIEDDESNMSEHAGSSGSADRSSHRLLFAARGQWGLWEGAQADGCAGCRFLRATLPAARIGLEQRTMACGSCNRPNLRMQQCAPESAVRGWIPHFSPCTVSCRDDITHGSTVTRKVSRG
ncbi:hypothetical protein UY3_07876 [Chelonia mydas]|uniref:Uncharacterized protein n=1 Tax=Chelonia mydas TaxID=8469 RepID=M7C3D5_CHEMY|nr:hypothetical protein UY3_07876 [Chelonia mydas]